jgi:hypothetical protein
MLASQQIVGEIEATEHVEACAYNAYGCDDVVGHLLFPSPARLLPMPDNRRRRK